jgi:amino acid adenylation domain-containing protein
VFEERVEKHPDAPAVEYEGQRLSYAQLNRRSNQVAHRLVALGAKPGDRVALCVDRGLTMMIGLMGILKAGAGYVPLDPTHPPARLAQMLADCAPLALLTEDAVQDELPAHSLLPVVVLDVEPALARQPQGNPQVAGLQGQQLAYVLYTSGSTGQPKGVMVEHRSVLNLWQALDSALYAGAESSTRTKKVAVNAAMTFDASIKMIVQLLSGRCLAPVPQEVRADGAAMVAWLKDNDIDVFDCTPVQLEMMCEAGLLQDPVCCAKTVLIGGEAIGASRWGELRSSGMPAFNLYGPTECTVDATLADVRHAGPVPTIGRPLQNVTVHVLDAGLQPVPQQVTGELYIGGAGVARGYLNRPQLTAERFIDDPFSAQPGARLYKTGDLGRWLSDGSIEYMGRNDFQVKLRGFRIELGEIEARLLQCEGVAEAVVLAHQDGEGGQRLVAYLRPLEGVTPEPVALRAQLAESLPEYMVPSAFVTLATFPRTPNGKLDRQALPAPDTAALASRPYEAPQGDLEQEVAGIWQELLNAERIGRRDDFFALGGHSLLAVQLVSRLRQSRGVEVALSELFTHPELADFAARLGQAGATQMQAIPRADRSAALPLSWAQQRLWFLDQLDASAGAAYHMPAGLRLSGRLDQAALRATLQRIVARHEALRTTFVALDGEPVQRIAAADSGFALRQQDLSGLVGAAQQAEVQRISAQFYGERFDLAQGPLIRGQLVRLGEEEHLLLINQHHIISDGWSIGVLVKEVSTLYSAFSQGRADPLPPLALQYADYAAWQRHWLQGQALREQTEYWKSHLAGAPELLDLPLDRARPALRGGGRELQAVGRTEPGAEATGPAPRGDAVHDAAGRLGRVDGAPERAKRRGDRHAGGQPAAARDRGSDRLLHQHAGVAPEHARRPDGGAAAGPGQGADAGGLRPPGHPLRAGGGGDQPSAQHELQPLVPDRADVRRRHPQRRTAAAGAAPGRPAPRRHDDQGRSAPDAERRRGRDRRATHLLQGLVQRIDCRADGGQL